MRGSCSMLTAALSPGSAWRACSGVVGLQGVGDTAAILLGAGGSLLFPESTLASPPIPLSQLGSPAAAIGDVLLGAGHGHGSLVRLALAPGQIPSVTAVQVQDWQPGAAPTAVAADKVFAACAPSG